MVLEVTLQNTMKNLLWILFFPVFTLAQSSFEKGKMLFEEAQYEWAGIYFQKHLSEFPKHEKTLEYLGDIAGFSKDWDTAMKYYGMLVEENENNANYHFKYGGVMGMKALEVSKIRALGYIGDIRKHFEKAVALDPNHIEAHWALVEFYIQLPGIVGGSEEKAIQYAKALLKISPVDGYLSLGYIAEYSNRPKDAESYYKKAIGVGGSPHTYEKLTDLYEKNDRPKEAIENASKSLRIHKRNKLNYQIGKIAAQYNLESDLGIQCLNAYIKNYTVRDGVPLDWAYYRMAQIYKNLGQKSKALSWIGKALESRPDFQEALSEKKLILAL